MLKSAIETYNINNCPVCGKKHTLDIEVFRDLIPNNPDKDIRVPIFREVPLRILCPVEGIRFQLDMMMQEDIYCKIIKLRRC